MARCCAVFFFTSEYAAGLLSARRLGVYTLLVRSAQLEALVLWCVPAAATASSTKPNGKINGKFLCHAPPYQASMCFAQERCLFCGSAARHSCTCAGRFLRASEPKAYCCVCTGETQPELTAPCVHCPLASEPGLSLPLPKIAHIKGHHTCATSVFQAHAEGCDRHRQPCAGSCSTWVRQRAAGTS